MKRLSLWLALAATLAACNLIRRSTSAGDAGTPAVTVAPLPPPPPPLPPGPTSMDPASPGSTPVTPVMQPVPGFPADGAVAMQPVPVPGPDAGAVAVAPVPPPTPGTTDAGATPTTTRPATGGTACERYQRCCRAARASARLSGLQCMDVSSARGSPQGELACSTAHSAMVMQAQAMGGSLPSGCGGGRGGVLNIPVLQGLPGFTR